MTDDIFDTNVDPGDEAQPLDPDPAYNALLLKASTFLQKGTLNPDGLSVVYGVNDAETLASDIAAALVAFLESEQDQPIPDVPVEPDVPVVVPEPLPAPITAPDPDTTPFSDLKERARRRLERTGR
jgi:hypothetical protein